MIPLQSYNSNKIIQNSGAETCFQSFILQFQKQYRAKMWKSEKVKVYFLYDARTKNTPQWYTSLTDDTRSHCANKNGYWSQPWDGWSPQPHSILHHSPVWRRMATSQTLISIFLAHSCIESWEDTPYESNRLRKRGYKFSSKVYFEFQYRSNNQIVNIMGYVKMKFHREILTNMLLIGS